MQREKGRRARAIQKCVMAMTGFGAVLYLLFALISWAHGLPESGTVLMLLGAVYGLAVGWMTATYRKQGAP